MATRATTPGQQPAIDDGQAIEDDPSPYVRWDHHPMTVDLKDIEIVPAEDYNGDPCQAVKGELLKPLDEHDIGETVIVGGGQTKLKRLLAKGIDQGRIKDGIRLRIEHTGLIGRMLDFKVTPNPIGYHDFVGTPRDDKPAPF
jgi:hypothetical protein